MCWPIAKCRPRGMQSDECWPQKTLEKEVPPSKPTNVLSPMENKTKLPACTLSKQMCLASSWRSGKGEARPLEGQRGRRHAGTGVVLVSTWPLRRKKGCQCSSNTDNHLVDLGWVGGRTGWGRRDWASGLGWTGGGLDSYALLGAGQHNIGLLQFPLAE